MKPELDSDLFYHK